MAARSQENNFKFAIFESERRTSVANGGFLIDFVMLRSSYFVWGFGNLWENVALNVGRYTIKL